MNIEKEPAGIQFQLSISFILKLTAAMAVAIVVSQRLAANFGYPGTFIVLAVFYAIKSAISIAFSGRKLASFVAFTPCFILTLCFFGYWEHRTASLESVDLFLFIPMIYMFVPTFTFVLDIFTVRRRSADYMLLRSILELAFVVPVWMFLSVYTILGIWR